MQTCSVFFHVMIEVLKFYLDFKTRVLSDIASYSLGVQLSSWWWRQWAPLKRRSTRTRLNDVISHKALIFILAAVRTWNIFIYMCFGLQRVKKIVSSYGGIIEWDWTPTFGRCIWYPCLIVRSLTGYYTLVFCFVSMVCSKALGGTCKSYTGQPIIGVGNLRP
jgi:hypothetical protein